MNKADEVGPLPQQDRQEIVITIHLSNGDMIIQPVPIDEAHGVQMFIDWYRNPGRRKIWTWQHPAEQSARMIHHHHIVGIEVEGYIEPQGRESRWYERLFDRLRSRRLMRRR